MTVNKIIFLAILLTIVSGVTSRAQQSVAICPDEVITLQAVSGDAVSYQWYRNSILMNNRVTDTLQVADNGSYEAKAVSAEGCLSGQSAFVDVYFKLPVALNDTFYFQSELTIDVWGNDTATCSGFDITSLLVVTPPLHGSLNFLPNGLLHYAVSNNYIGLDSFQYSWLDQSGRSSNIATVYLHNDDPLAVFSLDFFAQKEGRKAKLWWNGFETQEQLRYELSKSPDGHLWQQLLAREFPTAYLEGTVFTHIDPAPHTGRNIYRLQVYSNNDQLRFTAYRELFFNSELLVYPNPTEDVVTIELDSKLVKELVLTDMHGRMLWHKTTPKNLEQLSLNKFAASVYFLRAINTDGSTEVIKIDRH